MSVNELITEGIRLFESNNLDQAIAKLNQAWSEIKDKNSQIEEQNDIQWWLGRCYLEQALKVRDITETKGLFAQAIAHYRQQFEFAGQLEDKQASLQEQIYAQSWLGRCYLAQAIEAKDTVDATPLFTQAIAHYQQILELASQLEDKQTSLQEQNDAQSWINYCYLYLPDLLCITDSDSNLSDN